MLQSIGVAHAVGEQFIHLTDRSDFRGHLFWARGYFASTVGRDEAMIRDDIRRQEEEDR